MSTCANRQAQEKKTDNRNRPTDNSDIRVIRHGL